MSNPNFSIPIPSIADPQIETVSGRGASCNSLWRDAALVVPAVLLLLYLGFQARRHVKKLAHRRSYVMIAYYALLWFSALLNLAWSFLQDWRCDAGKAVGWNLLSLTTELGMLLLEISIVAFLLQENYSSGLESLAHTFLISGSVAAADVFLQAIFIFGFRVPLLVNSNATDWGKWSVLFVQTLMLTAIYCYILFVHYSKWRDKLPPRPSFYNYVVAMFAFNVMVLLACGVAGFGFSLGIWCYNILVICRHSLYLPYLYMTFLADFFQEEDWLLDTAYYSEMKEAGFFDTDWE